MVVRSRRPRSWADAASTSSCPSDAAAADEAIRTADAVIVTGYGRLDAGRVAGLERCVGILCYSIGMDKVDGPAASAAGIPVRNVPDYCTDEVSDHAMALLLAAQRRMLPIANATAAGRVAATRPVHHRLDPPAARPDAGDRRGRADRPAGRRARRAASGSGPSPTTRS